MARLARWCFAHRRRVVAVWILALVAAAGITAAAGSSFNTNLSLPNTDSQAAVRLLTTNFPAAAGEGDQIVIQTTHGSAIRSAPVQAAVTGALARVSAVPGVASVASPYAQAGAAQISRSGTIAFARVTWDRQTAQITAADAHNVIAAAQTADGRNVQVSLSGPSITNSERTGLGKSVGVGVIAALIILLIVFGGALLSALMPLVTAILALGIGVSLIGLLSRAFDVSSVSTQLAVLIGLGVSVDYGLFIISRHRTAVKRGLSYTDAAAEAGRTSGRTVVLAGLTVCIALLGQFALGVSFLYGVSVAAAITVALTMATSLTFLPAMLGFLGPRVLSRRERAALATGGPAASKGPVRGCAGPRPSRPARPSWRWPRSPRWSSSPCRPSAFASVPPTPAPTRPTGPRTRRTRPWPADSVLASTGRSSWLRRSDLQPASQLSASSSPLRPGHQGWHQ